MRINSGFLVFIGVVFVAGTLSLVEWKNRLSVRGWNASDSNSSHTKVEIRQSILVQVIGKNFRWDFRYPGKDGKLNTADDTYSERKLFLPPGKKVTFHITSDDYVYILGIPLNENGSGNVEKQRQIAVPEMTHFIEYQFTKSGEYDLMVDPLCGFQSLHDPKMGQIVVTDDHSFQDLFPHVANETGNETNSPTTNSPTTTSPTTTSPTTTSPTTTSPATTSTNIK